MITIDTLFENYTKMRLGGKAIDTVYSELQDIALNHLTREERNTLSIRCNEWELDRTQPDRFLSQQEALIRSTLTNISVKITLCPACDAPNAEGFTRCQVCNEPLAVAHEQKHETTDITKSKGALFERHSQLVLKVVTSNDRLVIQPQISPTGVTIGRKTIYSDCDVDLDSYGGAGLGVSRNHALIRFDRANNRLIIIDNDSTNGTFINGDKVRRNVENILSDGDELKLAHMRFRVKFK